MLPVLTRSVSLLRLLLRDSAIDLELASSVVGLDPGMSLGTLQLANARRHQGDDPIWQLPSAVVQAGRERLEHFILHAPTIESPGNSARRAQLEKVVEDAVVRACVAHGMTRELGQSNPRKAFLCGLLFESPLLAHGAAGSSCSRGVLFSTMSHILPASMVRAVMAVDTDPGSPGDPLFAAVLMADAVVKAQRGVPERCLQECASSSFCDGWIDADRAQRRALLSHASDVANWAAASLHRMDPWEFMARLESRNFGDEHGRLTHLDR